MTVSDFISRAKSLGFELNPLGGVHYTIPDFYLGRPDPSAELWLEEESFNVRHPRGHWVLLTSPEELISLNYFEFHLPKIEHSGPYELSQFWKDLFEKIGLFDNKNKEFRSARIRSIFKKLEEHFMLESGIKNIAFWEEVAKEFPECVYVGPAFRAVLTADDDFKSLLIAAPGYSWTLSLSGVKNFINHGDVYHPKKEDPGFFLVSGVIKGISLVHIAKFFSEKFNEVIPVGSQFNEEEVILLELISVNEPKFMTAKELNEPLPRAEK